MRLSICYLWCMVTSISCCFPSPRHPHLGIRGHFDRRIHLQISGSCGLVLLGNGMFLWFPWSAAGGFQYASINWYFQHTSLVWHVMRSGCWSNPQLFLLPKEEKEKGKEEKRKIMEMRTRSLCNTLSPTSRDYEYCDYFISDVTLLPKQQGIHVLGVSGPFYESNWGSP